MAAGKAAQSHFTKAAPKRMGMVYIVESPTKLELLANHREGPALKAGLELSGFQAEVSTCPSPEYFKEALKKAADRMYRAITDLRVPALHLSAHGSKNGLVCGQDEIKWTELAEMLRPVNDRLQGFLFLTISACYAANALHMARDTKRRAPFSFLVGPSDTISWPEGLIGFLTFYHLAMTQGATPEDAVAGMNAAAKPRKGEYLYILGTTAQAVIALTAILNKPKK